MTLHHFSAYLSRLRELLVLKAFSHVTALTDVSHRAGTGVLW